MKMKMTKTDNCIVCQSDGIAILGDDDWIYICSEQCKEIHDRIMGR
jgi:predicted nucleic acid-binding Zn ribbon protein